MFENYIKKLISFFQEEMDSFNVLDLKFSFRFHGCFGFLHRVFGKFVKVEQGTVRMGDRSECEKKTG